MSEQWNVSIIEKYCYPTASSKEFDMTPCALDEASVF
jgi:hypothetical protein